MNMPYFPKMFHINQKWHDRTEDKHDALKIIRDLTRGKRCRRHRARELSRIDKTSTSIALWVMTKGRIGR